MTYLDYFKKPKTYFSAARVPSYYFQLPTTLSPTYFSAARVPSYVETVTPTVNTDYSGFVVTTPTGRIVYKDGVTLDNVHSSMTGFINLLSSKGLGVRVTEGYSTHGHVEGSKHGSGKAIDFTPIDDDYDHFELTVASDPEILEYMRKYNITLLNEKKKPSSKSTGPHFHAQANN